MDDATLLAYINGNLSDCENKKVDIWASKSLENHKRLEQIYYTTLIGKSLAAYESADVETALNKFYNDTPTHIKGDSQRFSFNQFHTLKKYGSLAAAFITGVILSVGCLLYVLAQPSIFQVSTLEGQRAHVVLPDGSYVWLNSSTELAYQSGYLSKVRKVKINGEAYFEVNKKKWKPFIVNSKGIFTQVLGTKFNVRARKQENKVVTTLFEGAVRVHTANDNNFEQILKPKETLEVDATTLQSNLFSYNKPSDVLLWINGNLDFNNSSLEDIAEKIETAYNVRFHFANDSLRQECYTCNFKTDLSLEDILSTLSLTQHFNYKITEDREVFIYPPKNQSTYIH